MEIYTLKEIYIKKLLKLYNNTKKNNINEYFDEIEVFIRDNAAFVNHLTNDKTKNNNWKKQLNDIYLRTNIYHYTSYETLDKILRTKSLLFSQFTNMNDKQEGKCILKYIQNNLTTANRNTHNFIAPENKVIIDDFINQFSKLCSNTFSMSFSFCNDDNAQWERYANAGRGICLVTNLYNLIKIFDYQICHITPVVYENPLQSDRLERLVNWIMKENNINTNLVKDFLLYSSITKDISFSSEKEIRLFITSDGIYNISMAYNCPFKKAQLFNKNCLFYYFNKKFIKGISEHPVSFDDIFYKIILGPRSFIDKNKLSKRLKNEYNLSKLIVEYSNSSLK